MSTPEWHLKTGDRLPKLRQVLSDDSGPLNLAAVTGVALRMRLRGASAALSLGGSALVVDAPVGVVEYTWAAGDTAAAGLYDAEWVLTYASGNQTVPSSGHFEVVIEAALG